MNWEKEDDGDVLVAEPEVKAEPKTDTDTVHHLILWDDEVNSVFKVIGVLVNHFRFTVVNAYKKVEVIQAEGKSSIKEGSIKELEKYFIILVDNELSATIE
jgi:hypothetical protein